MKQHKLLIAIFLSIFCTRECKAHICTDLTKLKVFPKRLLERLNLNATDISFIEYLRSGANGDAYRLVTLHWPTPIKLKVYGSSSAAAADIRALNLMKSMIRQPWAHVVGVIRKRLRNIAFFDFVEGEDLEKFFLNPENSFDRKRKVFSRYKELNDDLFKQLKYSKLNEDLEIREHTPLEAIADWDIHWLSAEFKEYFWLYRRIIPHLGNVVVDKKDELWIIDPS